MRELGLSFILCIFTLFSFSEAGIYQSNRQKSIGEVAQYPTTYSPWNYGTRENPWNYGTSPSYPWNYGTSENPWNYGMTTAYPWNYGTSENPWNYGTSPSYPWNYGTSENPWNYGMTTAYPWNSGTSDYPWNYGTSPSYPWNYGTSENPWNSGTTHQPNSGMCPDGYTSLNDLDCVKIVTTPMSFSSALRYCQNESGGRGKMVSIFNAINNRALVRLANSMGETQPLWIGLNCTVTGAPSYCQWVDGSGRANLYSNFANGNPFVDIGQSVYMLTNGASSGKWISGDGDLALGFICEAPPKMEDCSNPFNGYCYELHLTPESDSSTSRTQCLNECGDVVSIHSREENHHILSIFSSLPTNYYTKNYIRIGGFTDGVGKYWLDGSRWDYSNLGYFNAQVGSCMVMAIRDDIVERGSWMSNNCAVSAGFVCKKRPGSCKHF